MTLYETKQLADSMRVVRKNTIAIAEDIPEEHYGYRPTPDSRSVRETLLHMASMMQFDFRIHEQEKRDSLDGFDFKAFFAGLPSNEKLALSKGEIVALLREEGEHWCRWVEELAESVASEEVQMRGAPNRIAKSRLEMLIGTKEHEMHHRAQLMVIERLLGIVPHLTRSRQRTSEPAKTTTA